VTKRVAFGVSATIALGVGALAAGQLAGASQEDEATEPATSEAAGNRAAGVTVMPSQFGDVLFDDGGFALYLFTHDKRDKSRCYGACAKAWPPLKGRPVAGEGANPDLLGTTKRRNGDKQVTYKGHPLYHYEHDDEPGEILCHDVNEFGGRWLVVQPDGSPAP
jgi:predicted lipoprotein with Yx(FWY)xxD motif